MQQSVISCEEQRGIKGETGREKERTKEKTCKLKLSTKNYRKGDRNP